MKSVIVNAELLFSLTENNMSTIQNNIEGLVPTVQALSLQNIQLTGLIAQKESELNNLPEVIRLEKELFDLKIKRRETENKESELREQGKMMMLENNIHDITTLDWTTISLQFTPGAIVIGEGAEVPDEYWKIKTTRDIDKMALKKAFTEGKIRDERIYIQKDCKFIIKQK